MAEATSSFQPGDVVRYKVQNAETWHQGEVRENQVTDDGSELLLVAPDSYPRLVLKLGKVDGGSWKAAGRRLDVSFVTHREHTDHDQEVQRLQSWLRLLRDLVDAEVTDLTTRALLDQCVDRALSGERIQEAEHGTDG